jgi:hypothetical protein
MLGRQRTHRAITTAVMTSVKANVIVASNIMRLSLVTRVLLFRRNRRVTCTLERAARTLVRRAPISTLFCVHVTRGTYRLSRQNRNIASPKLSFIRKTMAEKIKTASAPSRRPPTTLLAEISLRGLLGRARGSSASAGQLTPVRLR